MDGVTNHLEAYTNILNQHLKDTQRHLHGALSLDSHTESPLYSVTGSVLWTKAEMNAFFRGLSIYSRFRPDLIAACVETKNVLEVVEYLDLLEKGSRHHRSEHPYGWDLPAAYEMSNDWITWEERHAELVRAGESYLDSRDRVPCGEELQRTKIVGLNSNNSPLLSTVDDHHETRSRELSPMSRRRFQKRMHMRRRRAKDRGEEPNITASLLKAGRRSKGSGLFANKTNLSSGPVEPGSPPLLDIGTTSSALNPLTSPKLKEDFTAPLTSHCVEVPSAEAVATQGSELNLIHVPNLRNFLRFHIGLHDKRLLNGKEDVDAEVVDGLATMIKHFLSDAIGRAVILLEERSKIKGSIKVWRQETSEENALTINRSIIDLCLEYMGIWVNKKQHFHCLLAGFDPRNNSGTTSIMEDKDMLPPPIHFIPRAVASSSMQIDILSDDEADTYSQDDTLLDQGDSLADKSYETGLWDQVQM